MKMLKKIFGSIVAVFLIAAAVFSFSPNNYNEKFIQGLLAERANSDSIPEIGIVLGAGIRPNGDLTDIALERVNYAMLVNAETKLPLLFSGGDTPYGVEAQVMNEYAKELGYEQLDHIEGSSRSTYENAFFSDELLDAAGEKIDSKVVLLMTSSFHSRRSQATFASIMPEREIIVDYPDTTVLLDDSLLGRWKGLRMITREYLAIKWYAIKYKISS